MLFTRIRSVAACGTIGLVLWLALLAPDPAHALDPAKALTQYPLRNWHARDGLPQNSVQAIVQTRDGFIWAGTQEGLVRFDGVRFTVFDRKSESLPDNYVFALHEDSSGALWIGTNGGLTRLQDGRFTSYGKDDGLTDDTVLSIREDRNGDLWIGTARGVTRRSAGWFQPFEGDAALSEQRVMAVLPSRDGGVWFGTYTGGVGRWRDGRFERITTRQGLSHNTVWSLHEDRRGALWAGTLGGGLNRLHAGSIVAFRARDGIGSDSVFGILEDSRGSLWFATDGAGLVRYAGGRFTALTQAQGLANDTTWPLLEDRDGSLWVGTFGGLSQLRDTPFTLYGAPEGIPERVVLSVAEDRDGALWIGTNSRGAAQLRDGNWRTVTRTHGLPSDSVRSVYPDRKGNIWVGTIGGLFRINGVGMRAFGARDGLSSDKISAIHEDREGALWVGTYGGGINKLLPDERFASYTTRDGLPGDRVVAIADRSAGGLWLGTDGAGLSAFAAGRFTNYGVKDGLAELHLEALLEDKEGTLWLGGTGSGLHRLRDGRFTRFTTRQGLADDLVHAILDDGRGHLWISSNRGLQRVSKHELEEVAAGRRPLLTPRLFGEADGMRSREFNGNSQPAGWRAADGRLWFPGMEGVVGVDPAHVPPVPTPAAVFVDHAVTRSGDAVAAGTRIGPGIGAIELRYTALHYLNPELLRFRYRLEGFDEDWIDAGTRRAAFYTNLPPGDYRFLVQASLPGGAWTAPAAHSFGLRPRIDQTPWFRGTAVVLLVLMAVAANDLMVRRHRRKSQMLAALVRERELAEAEVRRLNAELEARVADRTAELRAANEALESFNYTLSHDLRGPLLSIDGFAASLLAKESRLDERGAAAVERIRAAALRMGDLITDMLDLAGVSRQEATRAEVDITAMARRIADMLQAREPQRKVRWDIQEGLSAHGDEALLHIALENLIGNAWKYTGKTQDPMVEVRAADGDADTFMVRDNGAGFDMAHSAKLFKAFERLHAKDDFPGTGIGLAIVHKIVQRHGGTIRADAAPGRGAAFYFTIPRSPARPTR